MKYEYWKSDSDGQWYWHFKAGNGEIVAQGEGYASKHNCLEAIKLMKNSAYTNEINLTPDAS
jgi:uncharacterized protein YegP (UPF0339 family)